MVGGTTILTPSRKALIIFARYPRAGEVKTRLGAEIGMEAAAEIYRRLAERTFAVARELAGTGVRLSLFYEPSTNEQEMRAWVEDGFEFFPQEGNDLGGRMKNAFRRMFEEGALTALIIGTDIPELDAGLLQEGFRHLDHDQVVIGPSVDGGYYLLGMQVGVGDLFSGVKWSSESVLTETLARIRSRRLSYRLLKELVDIDTKEDWERFVLTRRDEDFE